MSGLEPVCEDFCDSCGECIVCYSELPCMMNSDGKHYLNEQKRNESMSKALTRDEILQARDLKTEEVEMPEWGGAVFVRSMTGAERDALESEIFLEKSGKRELNHHNLRGRLVARTVVDEEGVRLFTEDDIEALGAKNAAVLERIFEVGMRLSGIGAGDVEELLGN